MYTKQIGNTKLIIQDGVDVIEDGDTITVSSTGKNISIHTHGATGVDVEKAVRRVLLNVLRCAPPRDAPPLPPTRPEYVRH